MVALVSPYSAGGAFADRVGFGKTVEASRGTARLSMDARNKICPQVFSLSAPQQAAGGLGARVLDVWLGPLNAQNKT